MAFQRPTLSQLVARIQSDFVSRLSFAGAILRRAVVYVLTRVIAGAAHMLHGHLEYLGRQIFPDQSDDDFLVRQASLFGLSKIAATQGRYTLGLTGSDGNTAVAGTRLVNSEGVEYTTDADATISGGVASVNVTAVLAGSASILPVSASLEFESPVAGIGAAATVSAVIEDGSDEETTEELRTRLLARMAEPPHGGNVADYVAWAKSVAGVTRVWVYPLGLGPGTVLVYFVRDNDGSGAAVIPSGGEVTAVQGVLDVEAPAHATATAAAPSDAPLAMTIHIVPDTSALRTAVEASLDDMFFRESSPGAGTLLTHLELAIGNTAGITNFAITVPPADVTRSAGQLGRRGAMTYT